MPLLFEYPTAAMIPESGTGMTTSASAGASSARISPILRLESATSLPLKRESGLEVYVLEDAQSAAWAFGAVAFQALIVYHHDLAGLDLPNKASANDVEATGFAGDYVAAFYLADAQRPEAVRVPKGDELVPEDHGDRVRPQQPPHRLLDSLANHIRVSLLELPDDACCYRRGIRGGLKLEALLLELAP